MILEKEQQLHIELTQSRDLLQVAYFLSATPSSNKAIVSARGIQSRNYGTE
jgi:hypothetical protein